MKKHQRINQANASADKGYVDTEWVLINYLETHGNVSINETVDSSGKITNPKNDARGLSLKRL